MIRWILDRKWLPIVLFSSMIVLFSSGIELLSSNLIGLVVSASIAVGVFLSRKYSVISIFLIPVSTYLLATLSTNPFLELLLLASSVLLVSAFGSRLVRIGNIFLALISSVLVGLMLGYENTFVPALFGSTSNTELVKVNSLLVLTVGTALLFGLAIAGGRLSLIKLQPVSYTHLTLPTKRIV